MSTLSTDRYGQHIVLATLTKCFDKNVKIVAEITTVELSNNNIRYIYSIKYYINNSHKIFLHLNSGCYNEKLLQGLLDYFADAIIQFIALFKQSHHNYDKLDDFLLDSKDNDVPLMIAKDHITPLEFLHTIIDEYIEEIGNEDFTSKEIATILAANVATNIRDNETMNYYVNKQLEYFEKKNNKIENIQDFCKYCIPNIIDLTDQEILFSNNVLSSTKHTVRNDEVLKTLYKLYMIDHHDVKDKTVTLDDYVVDDNVVETFDSSFLFSKLFFHGIHNPRKDFVINIEYIKKFTIEEIENISNNVSLNYKHDYFVKIIDTLWKNDTVTDDDYNEFMNTIRRIFNFTSATLYNFIQQKYSVVFNKDNSDGDLSDIYYTNRRINKLFIKYVINGEDDTTIKKLLFSDYYKYAFLQGMCTDFVYVDDSSDDYDNGQHNMGMYIIDQLYTHMNFEEMFDFFDSLSRKPTVDQWLDYLDHYEEYKELPVSWWIELA